MTGLFRVLLIVVVIYYGLKLIVRYLLPYLLKLFINKQQEKFYSSQNTNRSTHSQNQSTKKAPPHKEKLGDYVDYEEIKD